MMPYRFVFVLEQVLGHKVHSMNIESALASETDVDASILKLPPRATSGLRTLPVVRNWSLQMSLEARSALRRSLAERPADCVFIHTQVAALCATRAMRQVPTIVSLDATPINFDSQGEAYGHTRHVAPVERMKLEINRRALEAAAAIVVWSEWAANSLTRDYEIPSERVHPIYPGVQLARFTAPRVPHDGPLRLLFVGGDFVRKGGVDLLRAIALVGDAVELDVVTSSPRDVPPRIAGNVRVHSNVEPNSPTMSELYRRSDVFVLPTRGDCTPLVIAEAMASGLPVVASTVGSIPDMVRHGQNGFLVPPGQPSALAAALTRLALDRRLAAAMGVSSRQIAEAEHDSMANCRRIFDLMRKVSDANLDQTVAV